MPQITEMFAFIAEEKPGDEGVLAFNNTTLGWVPMVGADLDRIDALRPIADDITQRLGLTYRIKHFNYSGDIP